jgi:hypothetical protein
MVAAGRSPRRAIAASGPASKQPQRLEHDMPQVLTLAFAAIAAIPVPRRAS